MRDDFRRCVFFAVVGAASGAVFGWKAIGLWAAAAVVGYAHRTGGHEHA